MVECHNHCRAACTMLTGDESDNRSERTSCVPVTLWPELEKILPLVPDPTDRRLQAPGQ